MGELVTALMTASSIEAAQQVVTSIIEGATAESRCPLPGDLRRVIYDRTTRRRNNCPLCGGTGSTVAWYLTTYRNRGSFDVERQERLHDVRNQEEANAYALDLKTLPGSERQAVVSGALGCHCVTSSAGRQAA